MKFKSIKLRVMSIIVLSMVLAFMGFNFITNRKTSEIVKEKVCMEASNLSYKYGTTVKEKMEKSLQATATLASSIDGVVSYGNVSRDQLNDIQKSLLKNNKNISAVWIIAEPNGLDGKDAQFAGKEGQLANGRYVTYFARQGDSIDEQKMEPDYTPSKFYDDVKNDKKPMIFDPYVDKVNGKEVLLTSIIYPILHEGKFLGLAAIDITLDSFQEDMMKFVGNNNISVNLISNNIKYIATADKKLLGKELFPESDKNSGKDKKEHISDIVKQAKSVEETVYSDYLHANAYRIFTPICITDVKTNWSLMVDMPMSKVTDQINSVKIFSAIITAIFLIIVLVSLYFILNIITKPLKVAVNHLGYISAGDFTKDLPENFINRKDEYGSLAQAINKMQYDIKDALMKVNASFEKVAESSELVTQSSEQSNKITDEISKNIEQITTSIVSQASDIESISEKANSLGNDINDSNTLILEAYNISSDTTKLTQDGINVMKLLDSKTYESNAKTSEITEVIKDTNKYANNAEEIIGLIDNIASQTNLLALNASIEAARAGEAGRGFSVVADEIRKLSEQTAEAITDIKELLENIQKKSNKAAYTMNEFNAIIEEQTETIKKTDSIFNNTSKLLNMLVGKIDTVKEASLNITNYKEDIIGALQNIAAVIEETAASAEEISSSTEEQLSSFEQIHINTKNTSSLVENLKNELEKFKVN